MGIFWIILIIGFLILILCSIQHEDPIMNSTAASIIMSFVLIFLIYSTLDIKESVGYKKGQEDALNGKWKYKIERVDTIRQNVITINK